MYKILKLTHEEWLEERKKGIGSSEVPVIMGLSRFEKATPMRLWRLKTGREAPEPENAAMLRGHMMEPVVAEYFKLRTGAVIDPDSVGDFLAVDVDKPWLRVSPDRLCWMPDIPEDKRTISNSFILECKTTKVKIIKDLQGRWVIPESWVAQVQYQMGVMGLKKAAICWLDTMRDEDGYVWMDFYPGFYKKMVEKLDSFWCENVMKDIPPEVIMTEDDAKSRWPKAEEGKKAVANEALTEIIYRRNKLQDMLSKLDKDKKECDKRIRIAVRDVDTLVDAQGNILLTYKNGKDKVEFDKDAFCADHPELFEMYCKSSPTRKLRFAGSKEAC